VQRISGGRISSKLAIPSGYCLAIVLSLAAFSAHLGDELALPVVIACALLGFLLGRARLRSLFAEPAPLLVGAATYVLFNASVILSGHWTWTGYNFSNDSAAELLLTVHLQAHGTVSAPGLPGTAGKTISDYLASGYPLGSQSLLGVVSGALGVPPLVDWQAFISSSLAVAAMAASTLSERTMGKLLSALAGFAAVASALVYQYALQGEIKELATLTGIICAIAVLREALIADEPHPIRLAVVGLPLAAILATYSAAGIPYVGAIAAAALVGLLVAHPPPWLLAAARPLLLGALAALALLAVLAIPTLLSIATFIHTAVSGYSGPAASAPALGPLLRPLPLSEISGIWLFGDFRVPVPSGAAGTLTTLLTVIVLLAMIPGVMRAVEAREPGPVMGAVANGLVLAIIYPRVVPYAQAKILMIASPVVLLIALQAFTAAGRAHWRLLAAAGATGVLAAILASDAFAYHLWPLGPTARMTALSSLSKRVQGRGPVLDSEFEQFAKLVTTPIDLIDGPDPESPLPLELTAPQPEYDHSFDLSEEKLSYVESFPYIIIRRSPVASRPPANFRLVARNRYYELWKRYEALKVIAQRPLVAHQESSIQAARLPECSEVSKIAQAAPADSNLVAAVPPPSSGFAIASVSHSPGWVAGGEFPGGVATTTPGRAEGSLTLSDGGSYRLWLQGNFPRRVAVLVDGHRVGAVQETDSPMGWLSVGVTDLQPGRHILTIVRPGGGLGPGNGDTQATIGALVAIRSPEAPRLVRVSKSDWRSLCALPAEWIETVYP